ncbi:D-2-hydroxyglutarate--pyruvate transhydrogenase DLD2 [Cyclospora cayetanensis]|uniref:D-2-hydroxyglutarate--pyruvate transhydrogenase DLD2 n=1 Tax=Cyclospora cayetanensis TaxID=88456 RepID=A0A6P6RZD2_9EIME|nr:D-2-hydroxyglutarate--pyruvate transhydrogenase DLD2 [Cyclospora cayetanensis]
MRVTCFSAFHQPPWFPPFPRHPPASLRASYPRCNSTTPNLRFSAFVARSTAFPSICGTSMPTISLKSLGCAGAMGKIPATPVGCRGVKFVAEKGLVMDSAVRKFYVPDFPRDSKFNKLSHDDKAAFRAILSEQKPVSAKELADMTAVANYLTDWLGIYTPEAVEGSAAVVLFPRTTEELQRILQHCSKRQLAVCIQSGNTGLVGGSVPAYDEVVLSLTKMNKILSFDAETGVLIAEAGCLISDIEVFLKSFPRVRFPTYMYPLDLASKGSCCLGGTLATAAGGNRYLRYGGAHSHVLGLEVVTGDGRVIDLLNTCLKNNTGLHLHHLFIGSEGVLGVVTKAVIQCVATPRSTTVSLLKLKGPFDRLRLACLRAKETLSDILSALEFFDEACMALSTKAARVPNPFSRAPLNLHPGSATPYSFADAGKGDGGFYLLMETQGQNEEADRERVEEFVTQLQEEGIIEDAAMPQSETQRADTWRAGKKRQEAPCVEATACVHSWIRAHVVCDLCTVYRLREEIAVAASASCLKVLKFDVSLEISRMYKPVELLNALMAHGAIDGDFPALIARGEKLLTQQRKGSYGAQRGIQHEGRSGTRAGGGEGSENTASLPCTVIGYGHIGDGNIHINVLVQEGAKAEELRKIQQVADNLVYNFVQQHGGSISAEHGVGILKASAIPKLRSQAFISTLNRLKHVFDPKGILNPYKGWRMNTQGPQKKHTEQRDPHKHGTKEVSRTNAPEGAPLL